MGYKGIDDSARKIIKDFLNECIIIDINEIIKQNTIEIKQKFSLKLPDSIIAATSQFLNIPLITADTDFKKIKDIDLVSINNI